MPLQIRPYQASDEAALRARFAGETRPPWLRLPFPYTLERLLEAEPGLTVLVAESSRTRVSGLVALDCTGELPLLVGPLVPDEQLADLIGHALLTGGVRWAAERDMARLQVKLDVDEDRGIGFFTNQGFQILDTRQYVLEARSWGLQPAPAPADVVFGPSPEMLSSDYLRLYQTIGRDRGWTERATWTRPQIFDHLQKPGVLLLTARQGDEFIGFAELQAIDAGTGELALFGMLDTVPREVAGAFLEFVLQYVWDQRPWTRVRYTTLSSGDALSTSLYMQHGFEKSRALIFLEKSLEAPLAAPGGPG